MICCQLCLFYIIYKQEKKTGIFAAISGQSMSSTLKDTELTPYFDNRYPMVNEDIVQIHQVSVSISRAAARRALELSNVTSHGG